MGSQQMENRGKREIEYVFQLVISAILTLKYVLQVQ